jgi:hypothetical protein
VSSNGLLLAGVAIALLSLVLPLARYVAMFRIPYFNRPYVVVGSDVVVLLLAVSTILVASLITRAQLMQVQVSLTHS